jgi:hypothetical protein
MDFIKKNWEKVLLGVVLIGLAVAVAFLPLKIASEKQAMEEVRQQILNPQVKPLNELELGASEKALKRAEVPIKLDFSGGHRLFNPVTWQKRSDGGLLKIQTGKEVGAAALVVAATQPLFTILSFDNVITNETGARYAIGIERQAAPKASDRRKRQTYTSLNVKTDFFIVRSLKGAPEDPAELVLELNDSGERVAVAKGKPFKRVDGHLADLKYPPETKTWLARRVGDRLVFGGEDYNIVAINESEVVLSARSGKKTTVRSSVAP